MSTVCGVDGCVRLFTVEYPSHGVVYEQGVWCRWLCKTVYSGVSLSPPVLPIHSTDSYYTPLLLGFLLASIQTLWNSDEVIDGGGTPLFFQFYDRFSEHLANITGSALFLWLGAQITLNFGSTTENHFMCSAHLQPKIFLIHAFFWKFWRNHMLASLWTVGTLSYRESWIHLCIPMWMWEPRAHEVSAPSLLAVTITKKAQFLRYGFAPHLGPEIPPLRPINLTCIYWSEIARGE